MAETLKGLAPLMGPGAPASAPSSVPEGPAASEGLPQLWYPAGVSTIALSPHLIPEVQRGGVGWILSLFRHRPQGRKGVPGQMATAEA